MLKRQHVSLKEWQVDYIDRVANKCGINKSDVLRTYLSITTVCFAISRGYKPSIISPSEIFNNKELKKKKPKKVVVDRFMDNIDHEARDASIFLAKLP